jgi:flagellar biosynthetic protein FlhB
MADSRAERTEQPTPKRLKDARERGQIARSRDLSAALSLAAVVIAIDWIGSQLGAAAGDRLIGGLTTLGDRPTRTIDGAEIGGLIWQNTKALALLAGPPALLAGLVSVLASVAQTGVAYSPKAIHFNWNRLSPATGLKRFAPIQSLGELSKSLVGIAVLSAIGWFVIERFFDSAPRLTAMTPAESVRAAWQQIWALLWRASLALIVVAAGDYALQRINWRGQVRMTRREVKDDARMQEGSPEMKARVRRIQREMVRRRMLQAVPTATVVVTNPTHIAVALRYRREETPAPIVVAKGRDLVAARIRSIALEHGVPIVENVALARALDKHVDVGDAIPAGLFGAVAEILAYLVRLKQVVL